MEYEKEMLELDKEKVKLLKSIEVSLKVLARRTVSESLDRE